MKLAIQFYLRFLSFRTTTDNGSNFVKAFVQFGTETDILPSIPSHDMDSEADDAVSALLNQSSEDEELEYVSVENLLSVSDQCYRSVDNDSISQNFNTLPVHMRCAAHTFNLVASKDADAALETALFKIPYRNAMAKARALWHLQSRSTVAADNIHSELGRRLVTPNTTRWNSTYDAVVALNAILEMQRPALHRVMTQLKIPAFNDQDVSILNEYAKVILMKYICNIFL